MLIFTFFVDNAKGADSFAIKLNNNNVPVQFCATPELIAKNLTIDGTFSIKGMKISFSDGYKAGEDELIYSGSIGNIVSTWFAGQGYLLLKGDGTTTNDNYRDAIRLVTYKNTNLTPNIGNRKISITLDDADYLPETGHFYRFVEKSDLSWSTANAEAQATVYYGLKGYLATITSQAENDFIKLKTKGVGWIGASDAGAEGEWRWVTGPEGLEDNGKGQLFYVTGTGPYQGRYTNWNSGEPNNVGGVENYAHITVFPNDVASSYKWNDLPNSGGVGDFASKGYLIEFGGFPGEPEMSLSATLVLQVNTMLFNTGTIPAICEGKSYMLNQADLNAIPATYEWTPAESLSSPSAANPYATPKVTTTYTVIGTRGECKNTANYTLVVNPMPVSILKPVEDICAGETKTLVAALDPGYTYSWSNNATTNSITVVAGDYSVIITSDKGCTAPPFTTKVLAHEFPSINMFSSKLICGDSKTTTVDIATNGTAGYSLKSTDSNVTIDGLIVTVPVDGVYPMTFMVNDQYCPSRMDFNLAFYKTPKGVFDVNGQIEGQKCYGYNLEATFTPENDLSGANYEWKFGGEIIANGIGLNKQEVPLGISLSKRDLELMVTQDGCFSSYIKRDILVIPHLNLTVDKALGCMPLDVKFTATSDGAIKYDWNFGDDIDVNGLTSDQLHIYQNSGFYDVFLKVTTADGCANEVKIPKMVQVAPIPVVAFSLSSADCLEPGPNQISFTGTGLNGTDKDIYTWDLDNFAASEKLNNPQGTAGPFKFNLKTKPEATIGLSVTSEFGCESLPGTILVKRKPDFSIQSDLLIGCIPFEPTLSGVINANDLVDKVDFNWDFGDGTTGFGSPVMHTYTDSGKNYTPVLTGKSSVTGCENSITEPDYLKTYPKPTANFSMNHEIVYNDKPTVEFTNLSTGANSYLWNFGDGLTSNLSEPSHNYAVTGCQTVLLEAFNEFNCSDTISHKLLVAFDRLFPPTGFSPNAPKEIDREFKLNAEGIAPQGYHFTVLSRWNDIVFEAKDEIKGWDGRMKNGSFAPAGAYVWILNFTDFLGRRHQQNGTVTLVY